MKCSGFTILKNAKEYDYPFIEAIRSILPLCHEFIVNLAKGDQAVLKELKQIGSDKIKIIEKEWDENLKTGGKILSVQTNLALERCTGDWAFYIQADEVLHEKYLPKIHEIMEAELRNPAVEGLTFSYLHFYGQYNVVQDHPKKWYQHATRIIKNNQNIHSWGDALDFRKRILNQNQVKLKKIKTIKINAEIYHYGWCRDPRVMLAKQKKMDSYYNNDALWLRERYAKIVNPADIYNDYGNLVYFKGSHPEVMHSRIAAADWAWDPRIARQPPKFIRMIKILLFYKLLLKLADLRRFVKRNLMKSA